MKFLNRLYLILAIEIVFGISVCFVHADTYKDYLLVQSNQTYFKYDDVKCEDTSSPECYRQTLCKFRKNHGNGPFHGLTLKPSGEKTDCLSEEGYDNYFYGFTVNAYSNIQLRSSKKTPLVVVSIHGLWGNTAQFETTLKLIESANREHGLNFIELTLPGHLKTYAGRSDDEDYKTKYQAYLNMVNKNKPFAEHKEWIVALENTLKIARLIGDKTIVIGQSTGGLLAALAAIEYPDLVDQLVLVEPALRVNKLMDTGACISKYLPETIIDTLSKLIGVYVPEGTSVRMGCEVQKLADKYFPRDYKNWTDPIENRSVRIEDFSKLEDIAKRIKQPVLLINNENDKIVSAEANRWFFKGLGGIKEYSSINTDGKVPHGVITGFPFPGFVAQRFFEFNYYNNPNTLMAKEFIKTLEQDLNGFVANYYITVGPRCMEYQSPLKCEENKFMLDFYKNRTEDRVCRFLNSTADCEDFKKNVAIVENYWDAFLQRAIIYGKDSALKARQEIPEPQDYKNAEKYFTALREQVSELARTYKTHGNSKIDN